MTKQPVGAPFEIYHSHNARPSVRNFENALLTISIAGGRLVFGTGGSLRRHLDGGMEGATVRHERSEPAIVAWK